MAASASKKASNTPALLNRLGFLILYGDGGRTYEAVTWDFFTDHDNFSAEGKFDIYSDIPDLTDTNKIGAGQCINGRCVFQYTKNETRGAVTLQVVSGPKLEFRTIITDVVHGKTNVSEQVGTPALDEK